MNNISKHNLDNYLTNGYDDNILKIIEDEHLDYLSLKKVYDYSLEQATEGQTELLMAILHNDEYVEQLDKEEVLTDIISIKAMDEKLEQIVYDLEYELGRFSEEKYSDYDEEASDYKDFNYYDEDE
jgi:hypothetical protein